MHRTLRKTFRLRLIGLLLLAGGSAVADDYRDARARLVDAYQAADFTGMRAAAAEALAARPDYPPGLFNRALAEVLDGDMDAALATLNRLADFGIDMGAAGIDEFSPLAGRPGWPAYLERLDAINAPLGEARIAYRYPQGDFIPEGIAIAADGSVLLGSIRHGRIVAIAADGESRSVIDAVSGPHWSVFGMRLVGDALWFVSSAIEQFAGLDAADAGSNALLAIDAESGEVRARIELPRADYQQVLGDLLPHGEQLYLSDQTGGVVYRYSPEERGFEALLERGRLVSPQGLALCADGDHLYVADYVGGLYRLSLRNGELQQLAAPADVSLYGIDGLYRYGDWLLAIQNGIRPHRVVGLRLNADGDRVSEARILARSLPEFDEPNLGVVVDDRFLFIANSHWNRFDRDGNLPDGLEGPIVLELRLDEALR